jgi:DNA-binding NarL/FixJ family response regulator
MISVFLLDDHPILVNTIESLLGEDKEMEVVGKSNGYTGSTLTELKAVMPNVILLDISMPECDSFELVPILKSELPSLKIVMYTMHSLNRYLKHFFSLGVDGYVIKSAEVGNLFDAIKTVYYNGKYFPDTLINEISLAEQQLEENQLQFTFFEKQIIGELKKKQTNKAIAKHLNCSLSKVLSSRQNLLVKTGTINTNEFLSKIEKLH